MGGMLQEEDGWGRSKKKAEGKKEWKEGRKEGRRSKQGEEEGKFYLNMMIRIYFIIRVWTIIIGHTNRLA